MAIDLSSERNQSLARALAAMGHTAGIILAAKNQKDARALEARRMNLAERRYEQQQENWERKLAIELGIQDETREWRSDQRERANRQADLAEVQFIQKSALDTYNSLREAGAGATAERERLAAVFGSKIMAYNELTSESSFNSGALKELFTNGKVKKIMKSKKYTPESIAALLTAAAADGHGMSLSNAVQQIPDEELRDALLGKGLTKEKHIEAHQSRLDAANRDWALRMVQDGNSLRDIFREEQRAQNRINGALGRHLGVSEAYGGLMESGLQPGSDGYLDTFYDYLDGVPEVDPTGGIDEDGEGATPWDQVLASLEAAEEAAAEEEGYAEEEEGPNKYKVRREEIAAEGRYGGGEGTKDAANAFADSIISEIMGQGLRGDEKEAWIDRNVNQSDPRLKYRGVGGIPMELSIELDAGGNPRRRGTVDWRDLVAGAPKDEYQFQPGAIGELLTPSHQRGLSGTNTGDFFRGQQ